MNVSSCSRLGRRTLPQISLRLCRAGVAAGPSPLATFRLLSTFTVSRTSPISQQRKLNKQPRMLRPFYTSPESTTVSSDLLYGTLAQPMPKPDNKEKLRQVSRDFRSDTLTIPTEEMFDLMKNASRGDDVYLEDETTIALQDRIAALAGKEAGLFCPTGTMTNQLALRTHLQQPPHSVLCDYRSHIHRYEAGGIAFHSQAATNIVVPANKHHLTLEEDILPNLVLGSDIHTAPTKVISLENTLNGMVFPQDEIVKIGQAARKHNIIMHCDGARMWNVVVKTGKSLKELCEPFDTVSLCMSKGLGAPIGSVIVGPRAHIEKARWFRKMFGGGVRQSGGLAAAAMHALEVNLPKLERTHQLATKLHQALEKLGVEIITPAETSMLFIDPAPIGIDIWTLVARAAALPNPIRLGGPRLVMHYQVDETAVDELVDLVRTIKKEKEADGWVFNADANKGKKRTLEKLYEGMRGVNVTEEEAKPDEEPKQASAAN